MIFPIIAAIAINAGAMIINQGNVTNTINFIPNKRKDKIKSNIMALNFI